MPAEGPSRYNDEEAFGIKALAFGRKKNTQRGKRKGFLLGTPLDRIATSSSVNRQQDANNSRALEERIHDIVSIPKMKNLNHFL